MNRRHVCDLKEAAAPWGLQGRLHPSMAAAWHQAWVVWGHVAAMAHMSLALPGARFPLLFSRRGKITQPRVSSGFIHIFFLLGQKQN